MPYTRTNGDIRIVCEDGVSASTRVLTYVNGEWVPLRGVQRVNVMMEVGKLTAAVIQLDMTSLDVLVQGAEARVDAVVETYNDDGVLSDAEKMLAVRNMTDMSKAQPDFPAEGGLS